ncbi:MAG: hypothetical protein K9J42_02925 [Sulfuritalea sp.]|nr:hypothetical protein [Sulfuritalea sp.]
MLTLIVPGLMWTRQALADLTYDLPLPAFSTLLGKGMLRHTPPQDTASILSALSGIGTPLPAAALRQYALFGHPGDAEWLCLDPVRLHFQERSLAVDDPGRLALTEIEARALAVSLAPTFGEFGQLEVIQPQIWNLRLSSKAPEFNDLPAAIGRSAMPLPLAPAYAPWRNAINEAQMQLHAHPVNQAREAAGQPQVNSLWPWGGGSLPDPCTCNYDVILSTNPVARGIARVLQIDDAILPKSFNATNARAPLAVYDSIEQPARSGDAMIWREQLSQFEAEWLAPALQAMRSGRLDRLRLFAPGDSASAELQVRRQDLWCFWRKPRSLSELANA